MEEHDLQKTPLRRCLDSGAILPKEQMIRFVISPEGEVVPDLHQSLPGRGIWVTANRKNVTRAIQKKLFNRFFEGMIKIAPDFIENIVFLLEEKLIHFLCLMRKQGKIIAGFEKLGSWIKKGQVAVMLKAQDAVGSDLEKLKRLDPNLQIISVFTREKINKIFGGTNFVYCGVQKCGLLPSFMADLKKFEDMTLQSSHNA